MTRHRDMSRQRERHAGAGRKPRRPAQPAGERGPRRPPAMRPAAGPRDSTPSTPPPATGGQSATVSADEDGMRVDRFLEARFPGLSFSHIQRIIRKGELRVNGKRAKPKDRLQAGQAVRIPPLKLDQPKPSTPGGEADDKTRE